MNWKDTIILIAKTTNYINGFPVATETRREVFANKKAVHASEFYQAQGVGVKVENVFEIKLPDFDDETELEYSGKRFKIFRTYEKTDVVELSCTSAIEGG